MSSSLNSTYLNVNGINFDVDSSTTSNSTTGTHGYNIIATRAWVNNHDAVGGGGFDPFEGTTQTQSSSSNSLSFSSSSVGCIHALEASSGGRADTAYTTVSFSSGNWAAIYCKYSCLGSNYQMSSYAGGFGTSFSVGHSQNNSYYAGGGGLFIRIS